MTITIGRDGRPELRNPDFRDALTSLRHRTGNAESDACTSCAAQERADVLAYWRAQQAKFAALLKHGLFTAEQAAQLTRHYATAQTDIATGRHEGAALVEAMLP